MLVTWSVPARCSSALPCDLGILGPCAKMEKTVFMLSLFAGQRVLNRDVARHCRNALRAEWLELWPHQQRAEAAFDSTEFCRASTSSGQR